MVAFLIFLRDWISSMRSGIWTGSLFFVWRRRNPHPAIYKDGLASTPSFYDWGAAKTSGGRGSPAFGVERDAVHHVEPDFPPVGVELRDAAGVLAGDQSVAI